MRSRPLAALLLSALAAVAVLVPALPAAAAPGDVVINEIESNGDVNDWIELVNTTAAPIDVSGWTLKDNTENDSFVFPAATTIGAGAFLVANVSGSYFGLGGSDSARLFDASATLADSHAYSAHAATTYGRCPDGTGDFIVTVEPTKGAANACAPDPADVLVINEVESSGDSTDWIELKNLSTHAVDASGLVLKDGTDNAPYTMAAGTSIPGGGYLVVEPVFGLGDSDSARLFAADGVTAIDEHTWASHATTSYGRCPDGVGDFATTTASTKGAANDCPAQAIPAVRINEVESSGGTPGDWAELHNFGAVPVDVSGWIFKDNDDSHAVALSAGTVLAAGAYFVIEEAFFGNGLGGADSARLFLADGVTLVDSRSWTAHASTTYGICGTEFETTTSPTKGAANDCSAPIRINEVESSGGVPGDWIEVKNNGAAAVDVSGWVFKDGTENDPYTVPGGTSIPAGGYLVVEPVFGLGGADSARVFEADGVTLVDSTTWSAHAATTYGRCPDGTGEFVATTAVTKNGVNACPGDLVTSPWPGGSEIATADAADDFGGDLSGLVFDGGAVWAVSNGDGILYRLVRDGDDWISVPAWEGGRVLHYADGTGEVDSEGVTVAEGSVFVSSERNNQNNGVSRLSVLRYDPSDTDAELTATAEWDLTAALPAVGANLGLEGITWVPDPYLANLQGYDPADYPGHGGGLFFVGVEATGNVHAFALDQTSTQTALVATFDSGFEIVADLSFDPERGGLWVACDDTCQGRTALFDIGESGAFEPVTYFERPSGMPNLNNEGFAIAPQGTCVDGSKLVLWADDGDTAEHSLRSGTIDCTEGGAPVPFPEDGLTDANRGDITAPATATPGQTIAVGVEGVSVDGWLYSTPVYLGERVVTSGGIELTIPAGTPVGTHRLAVTALDGSLIGWADITIVAAAAPGLALTGAEAPIIGIAAAVLLLAAGAALVVVRRRARS